ncbi:hypothetical protein LCGC14_2892140 [marine sediment metagenome]|uniref:ATPase AAA-type core domain-containing protein n=1 Tax=marine sediment metagenome TaxID=412755 RepID=A0A0F8XX91_9ZZZZ
MYDLVLVYGDKKTGKTKLAGLLARILGASLADFDDPDDTIRVIQAHQAYPIQPLIITMMESEVVSKVFPKGSPFIMAAVDIAIHMPHMNIVKDRAA